MTDRFEAQLGDALRWAREIAPDYPVPRLERKLRQIHAERPDLSVPEAVSMAFDVFQGEAIDARIAMEEAHARVEEAAAAEARAAAMQRIAERTRDLDALEAQFPGRATMAEILAEVGGSWADLGLSEQDGLLVEEIRRGMGKPEL